MHKNDEHLIYNAVNTCILETVRDTVKQKLKTPEIQEILSEAVEDMLTLQNVHQLVSDYINYSDEFKEDTHTLIGNLVQSTLNDRINSIKTP